MKDIRIWIIFLIIFINMLGFSIILPLLPYYVESFGAGPITIGLLTASYSLFQLLSAPILGELSDKFGRRPVLLFSIGGTALSFGLLGLANSIPLLFLSRIIDGASGGNISTAQAYIADITSKENRTQGMGMMMAAFSLGMILGPAVGGLLSVYGYAVPAFVAGAVALIATVFTYFFLPESIKTNDPAKAVAKKRKGLINLRDFYDALTHPEVGLFLTISFIMMFAFSMMQGTFALFSEHNLHLTAKDNGYIFAYLGFVGIVMQMFFLKRLLKWLPERRVIVTAIICMAIALGLIALSTNIALLFMAVTLIGLGHSLSGPVLAGLISKKTPDNEQGNIAGMNQSVGSMARILGPVLGTFVYSQLGFKAPYLLATAILGTTALFSARHLLLATVKK
jgi:DHA1 family tetracycline resistance protein-like MFS transporter